MYDVRFIWLLKGLGYLPLATPDKEKSYIRPQGKWYINS